MHSCTLWACSCLCNNWHNRHPNIIPPGKYKNKDAQQLPRVCGPEPLFPLMNRCARLAPHHPPPWGAFTTLNHVETGNPLDRTCLMTDPCSCRTSLYLTQLITCSPVQHVCCSQLMPYQRTVLVPQSSVLIVLVTSAACGAWWCTVIISPLDSDLPALH